MLREVLRASNDARLVPHGHPHCLRLVEGRVRKGGEADQTVGQRLRKPILLHVQLIGHRDRQGPGHGPRELPNRRRLALPGSGQVLIVDETHVQRMAAIGRAKNGRLDVRRVHRCYGSQVGPLVRVGVQIRVDEHAASRFARRLLQRQSDQIAEATFRHGVLVRKQAVVRREFQLPQALTGMTDDRSTKTTRLTRSDAMLEEDPGVRAVSRSRDLQRHRHTQRLAGI